MTLDDTTLDDISTIRIAASDLNGQMRGKRLPAAKAAAADKGAVRMPLSALNVDIRGEDVEGSPLVFETGDADGALWSTERGPVPMPWLDTASALIPVWMTELDGTPFLGDPRRALAHVIDRFGARGWSVMAATEMEFCLVDDSGETPRPPLNPITKRRLYGPDILSLDEMDAFDAYFSELYEGCKAMGLPVESIINESGLGQFEVTLSHQDALKAADDAWLFKTLARGIARRHGVAATFMAKPYADSAGNGMHVHFSVLDGDGVNIFDDGGDAGTEILRHAVAGCVKAMPASTLIFAPHGPSYDRFAPGAHAPTSACWAYENRTAAIRIPGGAPKARRIEHRVAGGDTNPYLVLAAVLGAAIEGIETGMTPPAPISGNAYDHDLPQLASGWAEAIDLFANDPFVARILPAPLVENLVMTKRQELAFVSDLGPEALWPIYLERS